MKKSGMKVVRDDVAKILRAVKTATRGEVMVGIPSTHTDRNAPGEPAHNAMLGYIHEHGAPKANIPARPHLVPGVQDAQPVAVKHLAAGMRGALSGDLTAMEKSLHRAGLTAQNAVRARLNSGIEPALSEATIAARAARGRTGTKPLIDTGQLRNSYTYVVRNK
ncbi:MAG TPA: hypothetical protein VNT52_00925 [Acidimicrobiales bacterium]|nr:hypothetical protein [Acidimicrobiales bacterium]